MAEDGQNYTMFSSRMLIDTVGDTTDAALQATASLCEKAGFLVKKQFGEMLATIGEYNRYLMQAMVEVLADADDLLKRIVGEEAYDDIKEAMVFLKDCLKKAKQELVEALDTLKSVGSFFTEEIPQRIGNLTRNVAEEIATMLEYFVQIQSQ